MKIIQLIPAATGQSLRVNTKEAPGEMPGTWLVNPDVAARMVTSHYNVLAYALCEMEDGTQLTAPMVGTQSGLLIPLILTETQDGYYENRTF